MTLKEKMLEILPRNVSDAYAGGVKSCPCSYFFLDGHFRINADDTCECDDDCEKCWSQPYIEAEEIGDLSTYKEILPDGDILF